MEIVFTGEQENQNVSDLLSWIQKERITGARFSHKREKITPDAMGAEFIPVIVALLSAPALVELVKCVGQWIQYRRPKGKITLRTDQGFIIDIDVENVDIQKVMEMADRVVQNAPE